MDSSTAARGGLSQALCCFEWMKRRGLAISDSIRSSYNNDNRNNTDSPNLLTARAEGARGEWETQFLETDWENITFLELCLLPLTLHLTLLLFTAFHHTHTVVRRHAGVTVDGTHQPALGFDEWSVLAVHLVVQPAGIAQVVSGAVTSPQRGGGGSTVYTLAALWRTKRSEIRARTFMGCFNLVCTFDFCACSSVFVESHKRHLQLKIAF